MNQRISENYEKIIMKLLVSFGMEVRELFLKEKKRRLENQEQ